MRDDRRTQQAARDQEAKIGAGGDALLDTLPRAERIEIRQDATSLMLAASGGRGPSVTTWTLDGVARTRGGGPTTTARWRGRVIEVEQKLTNQPAQLTAFSFDGAWLVIKDARLERPASGQPSWRSRLTYYGKAPGGVSRFKLLGAHATEVQPDRCYLPVVGCLAVPSHVLNVTLIPLGSLLMTVSMI